MSKINDQRAMASFSLFGVLLILTCAPASMSEGVSVSVTIDVATVAARSSPFLASHGAEMWQVVDFLPTLSDPRGVAIAAHLAPSVLRVGGITADWVRWTFDGDDASAPPAASDGPLRGSWPSAPRNVSVGFVHNLTRFAASANLSLLLDLNELLGRNCNTTKPGCASCDNWCGSPPTYPAWDTSNVRALLQLLHDEGAAGGGSALVGFEVRGWKAWR